MSVIIGTIGFAAAIYAMAGPSPTCKETMEKAIIQSVSSLSENCAEIKRCSVSSNWTNGILSQKKEVAIKEINEIGKLQYDWNQNGAEPFSEALIEKCREIISNLNIIPKVYPVANNSLQFEYYKKDGSLLEINIYEDHLTMFMKKEKDNKGKWIKISKTLDSEDDIVREVDAFYE